MKLSDDDLRASLERRANDMPQVDMVSAARQVVATPQRRKAGSGGRFLGLAGAAASVVVAFALVGSLALRPDTHASPAPGSTSGLPGSAAPTATRSQSPAGEPWTDLVWGKADATPFAFDGNTYVQGAVPDGTGFIAVGYTIDTKDVVTGHIWRTPDGRSWGLVDGHWFSNIVFDRILRLGDGFVMVGQHREPDVAHEAGPIRPAVWSSVDGIDWQERTPSGVDDLFVSTAAAGPAGLLMLGADREGRRFWLKADTAWHWTRLDAAWPDDVRISALASVGTGWIASGARGIDTATHTGGVSTGVIWTSSDGVTWSPAEIDQPGGSMSSIRRVTGGYVATGSDRNIACTVCLGALIIDPLVTWFSSDGLSWRRTGAFQTRIGNFIGGAFATNDGQRMLVFEMGVDRRLKIEETLDGVQWHEIAMGHETTMSSPDVEAFPAFRVPFVGNAGLIAFADGPDSAEGVQVSPVPWHALAADGPPPNAATFPPRPFPSDHDVVCPGTEPCGP
jgi:hypothetical protein